MSTSRRRVQGIEGSLTAFVAVLGTALFALLGLVVDGGRAVVEKRHLADSAALAARAGAERISMDALRSGDIVVDPAAALRAASDYLAAQGEAGTVSVSGDTVTVRVESKVATAILGIVGIRDIPVSAAASAADLHGVTQEDG